VNNADQSSQIPPEDHLRDGDAQKHCPRLSERLALRPKEAAEALGVVERTVRKWMRDDALPYRRLDGVVLIPRRALEQWLEEQIHEDIKTDDLAAQILDDL
jgi:excisionase family DNA binding protein